MSISVFDRKPFMRLPRGKVFVPQGAPHTAGLRGLWAVPQGANSQGKFIPNLVNPGFGMTRVDSADTGGEPVYHPTTDAHHIHTRGLLGNVGIVVSGSSFGSYGRARTEDQADFPWKPATNGGHQPVTVAVLMAGQTADGSVAFAVSNRTVVGGLPYIGFRQSDFGYAGLIQGTTLVTVFPSNLTATAFSPVLGIMTTRSQTDHEAGGRVFGDGGNVQAIGFGTSTTNCGAAAADGTTVTVAGRAQTTNSGSSRYTFLAAWFWDRGMTREEMTAFLLNPFSMIRPAPVLGAFGDFEVAPARRSSPRRRMLWI